MTGTVITTKGRSLIAKMIATGKAVEFTRAAVGTGNIPEGYDPAGMAGLNRYRMDGKITAMSSGNETAYITFQIASRDVNAGFVVTEAGLFAADPDEGEILYAYLDMSDDPQYIYKNGGEVNKVAEITLGVIIGQVERITAVISPDGLVTRKQLDEALDGKVSKEIGKGLSENDFTDAYKDKLERVEDGANNYMHPATHPAGMIVPDSSHRFVSDAEKTEWNALHEQLVAYTNQKIADLINGAPSTLDTLKEVADAIAAHKNIMDALDAAIGKKANAAEFDSHARDATKHVIAEERTKWNAKLNTNGNGSDLTVNFSQASTRANIGNGESLKTIAGKIMKWFADLTSGAASTLLGTNLTANRALVANDRGKVAVSAVTATELGYLAGVTSKVQDQLNGLNTGLSGMLSPIMIVYNDYDVRPTANNSVVDLTYDISDLILSGYVISQIVDVKVLYTDSLRYQQVTITNLSSQSATAKIMCLNTVPFKIRIYALIYRKSAIAN